MMRNLFLLLSLMLFSAALTAAEQDRHSEKRRMSHSQAAEWL
jgi:hypothetical protein